MKSVTQFSQGQLKHTRQPFDLALDGKGKKVVNMDRTKLEFSMTTPHLGKIGCEIKILNRSVNLKLYVEEHLRAFAESHLKELKNSLEKLNYSVALMQVSTRTKELWPSQELDWDDLEKMSVSA